MTKTSTDRKEADPAVAWRRLADLGLIGERDCFLAWHAPAAAPGFDWRGTARAEIDLGLVQALFAAHPEFGALCHLRTRASVQCATLPADSATLAVPLSPAISDSAACLNDGRTALPEFSAALARTPAVLTGDDALLVGGRDVAEVVFRFLALEQVCRAAIEGRQVTIDLHDLGALDFADWTAEVPAKQRRRD